MAAPRCTTAALAPPSATRFAIGGICTRPGIGPTVIPWSIGTMTVLRVFRSTIRSRRIRFPIIVPPSGSRGREVSLLVDLADLQQVVEVGRAVGIFERLVVLHLPGGDQFREIPVDAHQLLDV